MLPSKLHFIRSVLLLTICGFFCACAAYRPAVVSHDPIVEVIHDVDFFRSDDSFRSLRDNLSDDPGYAVALGDRVTTAGIQFSGPIARISVADVLLTTLRNNRAIQIEDYNRSMAEDAIEAAKGIYDLLLSASWDYSNNNSQAPFRVDPSSKHHGLLVNRSRQHANSISLSQLVPTGGLIQLFANRFYYSAPGSPGPGEIEPYHTVAMGIGLVQPLLRGAGPHVTNAPIRIARLEEGIAQENFHAQILNQLDTAIKLYWDLVFALNNYEVQRLSLERANELLRIAIIKRDVSIEPPNTVLQAEAEAARREALVIDAQRAIADVQDALKRIMNIVEGSNEWEYNLIPIEAPAFTPLRFNEEAVYQEALLQRPEYRAAALSRKIVETRRDVARNDLLPSLDLSGSVQVSGLEDSFGGAADNMATGRYDSWNLGLQLSYPLQNRTARATHRRQITAVQQQEERIRDLEDRIRFEVRTAIRTLETDLNLINALNALVRSEEAKLDSQRKRYEVGFATIFEVIQFQEDFANAQVAYVQSVVNYNKAQVELQRVKGSLLKDYGVELLETPSAAE